MTTGTSSTFNITDAAASQLIFTTDPTITVAGVSISPVVRVSVEDAFGNVVTSDTSNVTVTIGANPGSGTLSGTATVAAVGGVAMFSNLSINKAGTGYTLSAADGGLTTGTSSTFNISPASASQVVFTSEPTNTVAGTSISPVVQVLVEDAFGNVVTSNTSNVTVAIGTNPGSGTLGGTATVTAVNGVARFGNLSINKAGTGYTLTAADGGLTTSISSAFDITPAGASQVVFITEPTSSVAGASIYPAVQAAVEDALGNIVTSDTSDVTIAIGTNPAGGPLSGNLLIAAINGVATFSNLSISEAGNGYTLTASDGSLTSGTSTTFSIIPGTATSPPGAATHLLVTVSPETTAGSTISLTVTALDAFGNTATGYSGTLDFSSSDPLASLPSNSTLTNGTGTFPVILDTAGHQDVVVTDTTNSSITGISGTITVAPGAANHYVLTVPSTAVGGTTFSFGVMLEDTYGNTVTGASSPVHFTSSDGAALLPADGALTNGAGSFSITLNSFGNQTITATTVGNASITGTSGAVDVLTSPLTPQPLLIGGTPNGTATVYTPTASGYVPTETVIPFGPLTTDLRTAVGDINGDGTPDFILATGPGVPFQVAVINGKDGAVLVPPFNPFPGFTGGGFVSAGDFLQNGRDQIVITPDRSGGPRVSIYDLNPSNVGQNPSTGGLTLEANYFTLNPSFRGGIRTAVGDLNGDGHPDLVVAAGYGGGPSVLVINGTRVIGTNGFNPADDLVGAFYGFDSSLRDGAYVAVGDVLGNGQQDLILGPGDGGPAEVEVLDGSVLVNQGAAAALANPVALFAPSGLVSNVAGLQVSGGSSGSALLASAEGGIDMAGLRVAAIPSGVGDQVNVAVGTGRNRDGVVQVYPGTSFGGTGEPGGSQVIDPFGGIALTDGVFVG